MDNVRDGKYSYNVPVGALVESLDEETWDVFHGEIVYITGPLICLGRVYRKNGDPATRFLSRRGLVHFWWTKFRVLT